MRNHIFLAMSTLPDELKEKMFSFDDIDGTHYEIDNCISQLEPIPRLMMKKHTGDDEFIIYVLCSEDTLDKSVTVDGFDYTAETYFEKRIKESAEGYGKNISFKVIDILDLRAPYRAMKKVINAIREVYVDDASDRLWVDTHGGLRDVAQIISAMMSLLRVYHIVPEEILGVEMGKNKIFSQREAFNIFEYVSGMNDFINFGSADVLKRYYRDSDSEKIKAILNAMDKVSDGTQLSDPEMYVEGIKELRNCINDIDDDPLLSIFADYIKQDYGEDLIPSDVEQQNEDVLPLAIVERCVDKGLYQQALTFLESLMPSIYVDRQFIYTDKWNKVRKSGNNNGKRYVTPEHYLFNTYIETKIALDNGCLGKGVSGDNVYLMHLLSDYYIQNKENEIKTLPPIFKKYESFVTLSRDSLLKSCEIKTVLTGEQFTTFCSVMHVHKVLKTCRNRFNHSNSIRPEIVDIHNTLKLYISLVKQLL